MSDLKTTPDRGVGEAAALLADLAQKAAGDVVLSTFTLPADARQRGLPDAIPVGLRTGAAAAFLDIRGEIEKWRLAPERVRGVATATTLKSFVDLVDRHKDAHSVLFARTRWPEPSLIAVIDYPEQGGAPRFAEHRVKYDFPVTPEFKAWADSNGKILDQASFAAFVEDRIADLIDPMELTAEGGADGYAKLFRTVFASPAELVELARGLEVNVGQKVKNAVKLQSGEASIVFETVHADARGAELHVPGLFAIRVPAFLDGAPIELVARLRYQVRDGAILWSYRLWQWEEVLRRRVAADFAHAAEETGLLAIEGAPEA